mgnify:CR=1 FL=1
MKKILLFALGIVTLAMLFSGCKKKAFDEYYGRPDWLANPIYSVLESKGNFSNYLKLVDKARYKDILGKAGYWTVFAPNDQAFSTFLTQKGFANIDAVDSLTASKIVAYSIVYNSFKTDRLDDYQSSGGWVPSMAFKRRTASYNSFYTENVNGVSKTVLSSNRNNTSGSNYYIFADNNNKYIPYFLDSFMVKNGLTASDYSYFYPNTTYTGFNVADAKVVTANIVAENGTIHEIDKVIMPLPSIDEYLASNADYSEFKKLFDKYLVQYISNVDATSKYRILTGRSDSVFIKIFNPQLAYSPNNENYLKQQDNDGQSNGWTMFVPTNDVLLEYINSVLLEHYTSLDALPLNIIIDFVNAHMWQTSAWPGKFNITGNVQGEPARFNPASNIVDRKILSNGIFYGTNIVQKANVFSTVYGKAYLNPSYSLMTRILDTELRYVITNPNLKFTIFMMSDAVLRAAGFDYNTARSEWTYTSGGNTQAGALASDRLKRILASSIVLTPNGELNNLSGSGIIETYNGEFIKWNTNKVYAAGNYDRGDAVNVTGSSTAGNGIVYYTDNLLYYPEITIGKHIEKLGVATTSPFNYFYRYLQSSYVYTASTGDILGTTIGTFYTVFIPSNTAIQAAVNAGLLPRTGTAPNYTPNFNPSLQFERDLVAKFIQYSLLAKKTLVPNGAESGTYETVLKKTNGDPTIINVNNQVNAMVLTDMKGQTGNVIIANSNNLSNRAVIHLTDKVMEYVDN